MNKKRQALKYVLADFLAASLAWALFYLYRKYSIEAEVFGFTQDLRVDKKFYLGITVLPLIWITFYAMGGHYTNVYRKTRLKQLIQTFSYSIIGVIAIFFVLLLDDVINSYQDYYYTVLILFALHFGITQIFRFSITTYTGNKIRNREIGFNTLVIGSNKKALKLFDELDNAKVSLGYKFVGFLTVQEKDHYQLEDRLKNLGKINDLQAVVEGKQVEEVIIAIESSEHKLIGEIIDQLEDVDVIVKVIPDMYDILTGSVRMNAIFGAALIEIHSYLMPVWQQSVKRLMDIVVSLFFLVLLSPVYLITAIIIKIGTPGPVFFIQDRIGLHGLPFRIIKFRSMIMGAETDTPKLASSNDDRITRFGKFMRKTRLDEIPQFFNVLKGDMSLVGPRPERQYFVDQIMTKANHYRHLHKVRPGITSWGQVKFGYAENVDQMIERLKYDVIYIENMSLALDIKILFYTVLTILKGRGK
ncbi:MAG: sugar transferase [Bacteroidia bacterium]|nr:sugar transferase [Bacteroidia bacterium]NNC85321.1 sugar transferase [Bacteroidia bacterium]NNM16086.1 sugar transferase [Bacteroidia bacterium]